MIAQYLVGAAVLVTILALVGAPSVIAAYQWRFGGGKLLNDRLGPKVAAPKHRF